MATRKDEVNLGFYVSRGFAQEVKRAAKQVGCTKSRLLRKACFVGLEQAKGLVAAEIAKERV